MGGWLSQTQPILRSADGDKKYFTRPILPTTTKTKTQTKCLKNLIYAIFLKSWGLTHSKYDDRYLTLVILFTLGTWSPWLPCSSHTFSSTGPSVSPFRDFFGYGRRVVYIIRGLILELTVEKKRTNVTNVTFHLFRLLIWGGVWKFKGQRHINATNVVLHLLTLHTGSLSRFLVVEGGCKLTNKKKDQLTNC